MRADQLSRNIETLITSIINLHTHPDDIPLEQLEQPEYRNQPLKNVEQQPTAVANSFANESQEYLQAMFESVKDYAIFTIDLRVASIATWNPGADVFLALANRKPSVRAAPSFSHRKTGVETCLKKKCEGARKRICRRRTLASSKRWQSFFCQRHDATTT